MRIILHLSSSAVPWPRPRVRPLALRPQLPSSRGIAPRRTRAPRRPSDWWKTPRYMQELKLTAKQSAELDQIIQASRARMTADKEDLDRAQIDFRQLMERPDREPARAAQSRRAPRDGALFHRQGTDDDGRPHPQHAHAGAAQRARCHREAASGRAESADQKQNQK